MSEAWQLLAALDLAAWERDSHGRFVPVTSLPHWLESSDLAELASAMPVLGDFLADPGPVDINGRVGSGVWEQGELVLQAWHVCVGDRPYVVIESVSARGAEGLQALRRNRQTSLLAEMLDRRVRRKGEFLARLSHELRTPLNSVIGFAMLLEESRTGPLNERQRSFVGSVHRAGLRLLSLVTEILDLSRVEAGLLRLHPEPFPIEAVIRDVVGDLPALAGGKRFAVECDFSNPDLILVADRMRFRQVLTNLVGNAAKYTPDGGTIRVRASQQAECVQVEVADTGIGVPESDRAHLFEEFFQATNHQGYGGSGLGLAIAKRLVERQGGAIGHKEGAGGGSVFWFTLPLL